MVAQHSAPTTWHGNTQESSALVDAIAHNCTCEFGLMGVRVTTCAPHKALTDDQRWLDGLLYARKLRAHWETREFSA